MNKSETIPQPIEIPLKKRLLILSPVLLTLYEWLVPHFLYFSGNGFKGNGFAGPAAPELVRTVNYIVIPLGIILLAVLVLLNAYNRKRLKQASADIDKALRKYTSNTLILSLLMEIHMQAGLIICLLWGNFLSLEIFATVTVAFRFYLFFSSKRIATS